MEFFQRTFKFLI